MAKIDVNKVAEILKKNEISPAVLRRVMEELNLAAQPDPGEGEKPPPLKKQFVLLISDPEEKLPKTDFAGWVLFFRRTKASSRRRSGSSAPPTTGTPPRRAASCR